jgi:hypothetical protein
MSFDDSATGDATSSAHDFDEDGVNVEEEALRVESGFVIRSARGVELVESAILKSEWGLV